MTSGTECYQASYLLSFMAKEGTAGTVVKHQKARDRAKRVQDEVLDTMMDTHSTFSPIYIHIQAHRSNITYAFSCVRVEINSV